MGLEKIGTAVSKEIVAWTKASSKNLLATHPAKLDISNLKYTTETASTEIKISNIIEKFKDFRAQKVVCGLLNKKTLDLSGKFLLDSDIGIKLYIRFLDVVKRRGHTAESIGAIINSKTPLTEKIIHSLEFKIFDKIKNIDIKNFSKLSIEERKSFINSFISINYRGGNSKFVESLPDIAIFSEIKKLKCPQKPANIFDKAAYSKYLQEKSAYEKNIEQTYNKILNSLLDKIPRGKEFLPESPLKINTGCVLDIKPPLTDSLDNIPTKNIILNGHSIRIGKLNDNGKYMIHNLDEADLYRLEGLLLTDPDAILCTGYKGGIGYLKGEYRPGLIVSPKSIKDLLIQSKGDISSGYGAQKNLYNIQNLFLQSENEANNYIPDLIRKKMKISKEEYNKRIQNLFNIHYIEDIKELDAELYKTIREITGKEKMFEGIMRPHIEGIYLPKGYKISNDIAVFAERYRIPILYAQ